jgi:hypothetical protein
MEDKEVKDKTVPVKAPEKNLKKPTGKSATGKPLDGIDINPQLNDVSTNGNLLKIRKEDSVDLTAPVIQERKALTLPQRQKRSRQLRAREPRMIRAREVAKTKLAGPSKIEQRAMAHARAFVKARVSPRKVPYSELTTSEKIQVDTAVAKKTKLIKRIAARLLPRVRKAEFERLKSFRNGEKLQDLSTQNPASQGIMPKVTEEMSHLFNTLDGADTNSLISIIEDTIKQFNSDNNPMGEQLKKMLNAVLPEDVVTESLLKKSEKTGIAFSTLKEVFDRGEYSWDASNRMTQEQFAFARVNSYIAKGKAWHMDADVREEKVVNAKLDESFAAFLEASVGTKARKKIEVVDRPPASQAIKSRQAEIQNKIIDESGNTPYVKPHIEKGSTSQSGWKASNKHGNVKYFGKAFKASAMKHAGISEAADKHPIVKEYNALKKHDIKTLRNMIARSGGVVDTSGFKSKDHAASHIIRSKHGNKKVDAAFGFKEDTAADREIGTDALVKKYKKDTPGQKSNLDESFNMAWTSGIGVTLSAADCGIQIKGGFALHPDVIEQMQSDAFDEEVRSADIEGVIVRTADGKTIVRKQKRNRKIIGTGNLTDGKPDDTI